MKINRSNQGSNPLEISNGRHSVKIYKVQSRGRSFFQLSFYRGGHRERRTFANQGKAKQEAKVILCQLAVNADAVEEAVSTTDIESLVAARAALAGIGLPLHLAVEGFAGAVRQLCGQDSTVKLDDPVAAVHRAVAYYVKHHPVGMKRMMLGKLVKLYKASRKRVGVSVRWEESIETAMKLFLERFSAAAMELPTGREIVAWLEQKYESPVTKNSKLKVYKAFAAWAMKEKLVGVESITMVDRWKEEACEVAIYTPGEVQTMLTYLQKEARHVLPFVAIGAFAGLRTAEIMRLDWKEIDLERGHIVVAAAKAKTAARRLVPISENLRAWLAPYTEQKGAVVPLCQSRAHQILRGAGVKIKNNALRHSYISYRLAMVHDTPKVALEAGNSPAMIFKHYRELVIEDVAKKWFGVTPGTTNLPLNIQTPDNMFSA